MLDDIIEIVLELIFDGMVAATESKKVPIPIRIGLGVLLSAIVLGILGLLLYVGINSGSVILIVLSVILMAVAIIWAVFKIKAFKFRRR